LFDREVYGKMDIQDGFADGDVGAEVACIGAGSVDRHGLGTEAASGRVAESVDFVKMASERGAVGESFDAQGTLVDVWEMRLDVEDLLERVVRPIGAVGTRVAAAESHGLGVIHGLGERDG
jgi:hypothetical protein